MEPITVIVENWPSGKYWLIEWAPVFIAVFSLILSLYSLYFSREEFRRSSRPYVWAQNFAYLDNENKLINEPKTIAMKVINAPAKIAKMSVSLQHWVDEDNYEEIFYREELNLVRFPAEGIQWTFYIAELLQLIQQINDPTKIERYVKVVYSSLDGGKEYFYEFRSKFNPVDENWQSITENGN